MPRAANMTGVSAWKLVQIGGEMSSAVSVHAETAKWMTFGPRRRPSPVARGPWPVARQPFGRAYR